MEETRKARHQSRKTPSSRRFVVKQNKKQKEKLQLNTIKLILIITIALKLIFITTTTTSYTHKKCDSFITRRE